MSASLRAAVSVTLGLALFLALGVLGARLWVEWSWFEQFAKGSVLLRRWLLQVGLMGLGLGLGMGLQGWLSHFWRSGSDDSGERRLGLAPASYAAGMGLLALAQLLPLALLLRLAQRLVLNPFDPRRLHGLTLLNGMPFSLLLLLTGLLAALLAWPRRAPRLVAALASLATATVLSRAWGMWWLALLAPDSGLREPMLGSDISFGMVRFPALALGLTLLLALGTCCLAAGLWGILARPPQLSDGRFHGFTPAQLIQLRWPLGSLALLIAGSFWLGRHQLLLSTAGSVPGAGWLDVHLVLPMRTVGAFLALLMAVALLLPLPRRGIRGPLLGTVSLGLLLVPLLEGALTPLLQLLLVKPRELQLETTYLTRSIRATRAAFQLDGISTRFVKPRRRLTRADVQASQSTLRNIRLWDSQPLLSTNRQLQQLRVYYRFSAAAVDRYSLSADQGQGRQLVLITARELDQASLPPAARTWVNTHLVFTHGYGFTVSPVNTSSPDGLPDYFISDLGASTRVQSNAQLGITTAQVRAGIPIGKPSLYFGALVSPYALAPTKVQEFDYPQGDENLYAHYDGSAGVPIGSAWGRLAAATYLREPKLLMQGAITSKTRLLLRREVRERLRRMAPFVRFEGDPYLASVQLEQPGPFASDQNQFWIVDGFTTSRSYPYSAAVPGDADIRYLRNSVKAVVDAYNGTAVLYVAEPQDPIIAGWQRLFPDLFQPLAAMPAPLKAHFRYPQRQFELQTSQLLKYHVTDPRVFYSGDDVWQVPKELYGRSQIPVMPYHISAQLTPDLPPEFLLLQPLTPLARPNLAAWLAARSDSPNYGELVLLRFPSQTPIFGPEQVQALINQNPRISQQFGLWDRAGSEVIQGNLLVVPVGEALLYVEPVYLKARNGGLPTLTRVVVSDGSRVAMETTLDRAIASLLAPSPANRSGL
ncbi:MAG: UPF0182 family protein [Cyanobacteria bacterium]|nr:UPF0182 family protein [Cyanobacteriota bacterium]